MSKYFYEWHWESISNLHIGEDGLEAWCTEDFDFVDSIRDLQDGVRKRFPIVYNANSIIK